MPLTQAELSAHVRDQGELTWVPAKELAGDRTEACVDGRAVDAVIGTPGGNAGELLLLLGALEATSGQRIDHTKMDELLDAYVGRFGRFYMHGDTYALATIDRELLTEVSDDEAGARAASQRLADPPRETRAALLDALCRPEAIGCGHLKLMLADPEGYGVRRELTEGLLRAFFRALWRGAPVEYVVLAGDHREAAVVLVTVRGEVFADTPLPIFKPRVGDRQVFVDHPQAAALLRGWEEAAVRDLTGVEVEVDRLHAAVEALAETQLLRTLGALASGLPIYEVRFSGPDSSEFEILDHGAVGAAS